MKKMKNIVFNENNPLGDYLKKKDRVKYITFLSVIFGGLVLLFFLWFF